VVGLHFEIFLATGYAVFLLGVSLGLDLLARHSHARSERYRTAGFTYHHAYDAWICPEDQLLLKSEVDHQRRLIRYRGRPQICNHCPAKSDCTDSDDGREVVRAMDPWPHSEAGRFHRGISVAVASIAGLILVAEAIRNHGPSELAVLGVTLVAVLAAAWRLHAAFRHTPANFPVPIAPPPDLVSTNTLHTGYRNSKGSTGGGVNA
jgi:hypothetical protein